MSAWVFTAGGVQDYSWTTDEPNVMLINCDNKKTCYYFVVKWILKIWMLKHCYYFWGNLHMFSGVFICTPMQPVFSKIKDPEEHNNDGVNHAALWRTNLPAAPCTPFTAAFWGLELLVCFQPSIIQSLQRCTLHKTLSFIWPLTVAHSLLLTL